MLHTSDRQINYSKELQTEHPRLCSQTFFDSGVLKPPKEVGIGQRRGLGPWESRSGVGGLDEEASGERSDGAAQH